MKSEMSRKADIFHPRTLVVHPDFEALRGFVLSLPERFEKNEGIVIHKGRNELRKMTYGGLDLVVKSFHRPNLVNIFAYEAYFLAFRIPFGICWDVLIFSSLYSFL